MFTKKKNFRRSDVFYGASQARVMNQAPWLTASVRRHAEAVMQYLGNHPRAPLARDFCRLCPVIKPAAHCVLSVKLLFEWPAFAFSEEPAIGVLSGSAPG